MNASASFDYESKVWGAPEVRLSPTYIQALKLRYCLDDMTGIRGRVLDIGCGGGNMPRAFRRLRPDLEVWGIDLSQQALASARTPDSGPNLAAGSGERLPFSDASFDAVTMFDVLEHVPDTDAALAEVRRVLKPGGLFHLFLPLEGQPWTIYALMHWAGWQAKRIHCGHIHVYSDREAQEQLRRNGFGITRARWSFHPLFAFIDVLYFSFLLLRGRHVSTSVEGYLTRSRRSLKTSALRLLKDTLVAMGYFESRLLVHVPGGGGHYTCVR